VNTRLGFIGTAIAGGAAVIGLRQLPFVQNASAAINAKLKPALDALLFDSRTRQSEKEWARQVYDQLVASEARLARIAAVLPPPPMPQPPYTMNQLRDHTAKLDTALRAIAQAAK
jgi:hypothetical protein